MKIDYNCVCQSIFVHPVFYDTSYIFWFTVLYTRVDSKSAGTALPARLGSCTFQKNDRTLPAREINNRTTEEDFPGSNADNCACSKLFALRLILCEREIACSKLPNRSTALNCMLCTRYEMAKQRQQRILN